MSELIKQKFYHQCCQRMLKIVDELYWHDQDEHEILTSFIDGFIKEEVLENLVYSDELALLVRSGKITPDEFDKICVSFDNQINVQG